MKLTKHRHFKLLLSMASIGVIALGVVVLWGFSIANDRTSKGLTNTQSELHIHSNNKTHVFTADLAITPQQKSKGLMHVKEIADDYAMVFVFDPPQPVGFWMKNTLIYLDMLFVGPDMTIQKIHPNAIPHDTTLIQSRKPTQYVIEIKGGQSQKLGIQIGDKIILKDDM